MKLNLLFQKENFKASETPIVRIELLNISTETLCFPPPNDECTNPATGSVEVKGAPVKGGEYDQFICHIDGRGLTDEQFRKSWIRLAPGASYTTKPRETQVKLSVAGEWRFKAIYRPPEDSFGTTYRKRLEAVANQAGCTLPRSYIPSVPVVVTVSD